MFNDGSKRALPLIAENDNPHVTFLSDAISLRSGLYQFPSGNAQYPLFFIFPFYDNTGYQPTRGKCHLTCDWSAVQFMNQDLEPLALGPLFLPMVR